MSRERREWKFGLRARTVKRTAFQKNEVERKGCQEIVVKLSRNEMSKLRAVTQKEMSRERDHTEQMSQDKDLSIEIDHRSQEKGMLRMLRERDAKRTRRQRKTGSRESGGVKVVQINVSRQLTPTGTLGTMGSRIPTGSHFL